MYKGLRFLFFSAFVLGIVTNGFSQDEGTEEDGKTQAVEYLQLAELMMESAQPMVDVRDLYVLAAEADPTNIKANFLAGDFHLKTIGKDRAVKYFLKVLELDPEYRFDITYWIGRGYQYGMDFDKALSYYNRYKAKLIEREGYRGRDRTDLSEVERRIYECENAREFVANPSHYSIVNVGNAINTEYEEYAPVLNEDETIMIFTTRRREGNLNQNVFKDNKPYEDIFISKKENGVWSPAQNIGEVVNTPFHDSNLALSADGSLLFLYKDDNNGDIYVSERKSDGTWTFPHPMSENINSAGFKESSISISPDQQVLFFASDRPGGYGGIDIYYSIKDKAGEWTRSKNLGPAINTPFDDDGPFIDYDGKTLYFSSQGRKGMGGHDIFKSEYDSASGKWSEPENLGFPINTPDDDIYFVSTKDGKRGYYASVREDGFGYTDIYMVTILQEDELGNTVASKKVEKEETKEPDDNGKDKISKVETEKQTEKIPETKVELQPVTIVVTVLDENKQPVDARISMKGRENNLVAGKANKGTGVYEFKVTSPESKAYRLSVEKDGYVFQNLDVTVKAATGEPQEMTRTVNLQKLRIGTRSVLRNIYFNFDKATFKDASYNELNKLESMMAQNPGMEIEISGHTDNIGGKYYNKTLSQRRANAVKDYLVQKGIDSRRIKAVGYGEERPLASNDDEKEGRELNRRVEFKVIGGK
ncbi:outer membrane protein [Fulvivirga imtechensis AK7]|uniref:Outer membrane protein n=1 Tax=Fulvivirga imtechensis AK7 TaxID=1237149 RepID=L8JNI6_9BACT|nr:OmpA family protein [Fulvivirga imtechensis]ELR70395.1 outer membrane protein [Fulvivirga imtechensis AK7]